MIFKQDANGDTILAEPESVRTSIVKEAFRDGVWVEVGRRALGQTTVSNLEANLRPTLFTILEQLVQHGTEQAGEAVCLMWDRDDGFFLSTVESGVSHKFTKDINTDDRHMTLVDAVLAAIAWHNKQGELHYMRWLKRLPVPASTELD